MNDLHAVLNILKHARVSLSDEKVAQADLDHLLRSGLAVNAVVSREHRLGDGDIPDFLIEGRYVIEVKMKGARKAAIYRQLDRYAAHPDVQAIILVTNLAMGLPPTINGKPTFIVNLGRAWL